MCRGGEVGWCKKRRVSKTSRRPEWREGVTKHLIGAE